ncbi:MAG: VanZ family protein [Prolixibacteraceae bacterium]|jgi:VanZ family protein
MIKLIDFSIKYSRFFFILWLSIIFYGCLLPSNDIPKVRIPNIDKIVHLCFYVGFTYLLRGATIKKLKAIYVLIIALGFGIGIEVLQQLLPVNRSASIADVAANTIGAIIGLVLFKILYKKSRLSKS